MKKQTNGEDNFNTLAQNETSFDGNASVILIGNGSDLNNGKAIKGRAKRKLITQKIVLGLIDVANKKEGKLNKKSLWNTFHCQNRIYTSNGKLHGKYCKNRFCTICCAIRKADIINRYLPVVQNWSQPHFVTLTVRAVPFSRLNAVMKSMIRGLQKIIAKYRKRNLRGKGMKLQGIRSLECNFNPNRKSYNPHFHLITPDKQTANVLVNEWLKCSKKGWTGPGAQNISKVHSNQIALIELIKYGSKIFTEPDVNKNAKIKGPRKIYLSALSNVFTAMYGLRIFERFGFNLPPTTIEKGGSVLVQKFDEWIFDQKYFDWINSKNGQGLSDYKPPLELIQLLETNIDTMLE
jgi:hypothetical protein